MVSAVKLLQSRLGDVSINLGRGQVCMSEHHLHSSQISTVIQQMGGKCVA